MYQNKKVSDIKISYFKFLGCGNGKLVAMRLFNRANPLPLIYIRDYAGTFNEWHTWNCIWPDLVLWGIILKQDNLLKNRTETV